MDLKLHEKKLTESCHRLMSDREDIDSLILIKHYLLMWRSIKLRALKIENMSLVF